MAKRRRSPTKPEHERDPKRVAAGMKSHGQSAGGNARRDALTPEQRTESARTAGRARGKQLKNEAANRRAKTKADLEALRDRLVKETGRARAVFEPM